jgi:hypothetical protein
MNAVLAATAAAGLAALYLYVRIAGKSAVPLPPGPRPVPILGNVRDLTAKELWLPARKWAQQYGERCKNKESDPHRLRAAVRKAT